LLKSIEINTDLTYSNSNAIGAKGQLHLAELVNVKTVGGQRQCHFQQQAIILLKSFNC